MINLFVNYYEPEDPRRKFEIDHCLSENYKNPNFHFYAVDGYLTFNDFFELIKEVSTPYDVNIIANADITFDDSILLAERISSGECYALTRWDVKEEGVEFYNHCDSQDVWIFRGYVKECSADFTMGVCGCDNSLVHILEEAGYYVWNPSLDIKCYHHHESGIRSYVKEGVRVSDIKVIPPPYKTLKPKKLL